MSNFKPEEQYRGHHFHQREILYRYGPPNSGKTHDAVDQFMQAEFGVYCSPLRLMAQENYKLCKSRNVECDLVTGEEMILTHGEDTFASHVCCTIHCVDLQSEFNVAVIDEIQLIADEDCGWAYTRALLGLKAQKIICCGDETALNIVKKLCEKCGDRFKIKAHHRPTELIIDPPLNNEFDRLQGGDCIVCFKRKDIYAVCRAIGSRRRHNLCVIFGSLPPAVKVEQTNKFNANYANTILVATDAIGMGMNLNIRRIVFFRMDKFTRKSRGNGMTSCGNHYISPSQLKQIAGRAGRMKYKHDRGFVTTFQSTDYSRLQRNLHIEPTPIAVAGFTPSMEDIVSYCKNQNIQTNRLSYGIQQCIANANYDCSIYFLCNIDELIEKAALLSSVNLDLDVKVKFCFAPFRPNDNKIAQIFVKMAQSMALKNELKTNEFLTWMNYRSSMTMAHNMSDFELLEYWYACFTLYNWLNNHFKDSFPDKEGMKSVENFVVEMIRHAINNFYSLLSSDSAGRSLFNNYGNRSNYRNSFDFLFDDD